jgi:hypothetical protein
MPESRYKHGSTPAAWTAVTVVMVAFLVGAAGFLLAEPWVVWLGVALIVVGVAAGKVMQMMGLGDQQEGATGQ